MKILYFAKLRQLAGRASEEVDVPAEVLTIRALIEHLSSGDAARAAAFSDLRTLKVAVNKTQATLDTPLAGANEVAFFPPVTGG